MGHSAEKDAGVVDVLERLVYLLERGDYVPFGLIAEARGVLDARVTPPGVPTPPADPREQGGDR